MVHPVCAKTLFPGFLEEKYSAGGIAALNERYRSDFVSYGDVPLPRQEADYLDFTERKGAIRRHFVFDNYAVVLRYIMIQGRAFWNTFILVVATIVGQLTIMPMAAFALSRYKLRSKIALATAPETHAVALVYGGGALAALGLSAERGTAKALAGGVAYADPRLAEIGARAILPVEAGRAALAAAGIAAGDPADYERSRLELGLPDGSRDLEIEKSILLESGFDELAGVDWDKGCYMGQELTARTHYRALIKKRLVPVRIDGPTPAPGTPILAGEAEVGVMRSASDRAGLALLKIDSITEGPPLAAGAARIEPKKPFWLKLPAS